MEAQTKFTNLIQYFNQNGPIKAKPPVPACGPRNEESNDCDPKENSESEEEIPQKFLESESPEDETCGTRRIYDDDSDEDRNNDDETYCGARRVSDDDSDEDSNHDDETCGARRISDEDSDENRNNDDENYYCGARRITDDDSDEDSSNDDETCGARRMSDDDSDEDGNNDDENYYCGARRVSDDDSDEDINDDDDGCCPRNPPLYLRSICVKNNDSTNDNEEKSKKDETNNDSSSEDEKTEEEYHHYEEVIINEEKEIKNVHPPPKRNMKGIVRPFFLWRTKYADKIEELEAKATATLETFKNSPLTEASYQCYKKLLMQTRGELKVVKPKNRKQRNKLENAVQFTEFVMKELDDEFAKYVKSISSTNK